MPVSAALYQRVAAGLLSPGSAFHNCHRPDRTPIQKRSHSMTSIRSNLRAVRIIALALAVSAIAAPAASARFDQEPHQQLPVTPPTVSSPAQPQTSGSRPEVQPNPDQQTPQTAPVAPILRRVPASALAAVNSAKEHALVYHVPQSARYSTADVNAYTPSAHPVAAAAPSLKAPSNGFDWGDAAIGAGITAAIALLMTGGGLAVRQRSAPRVP
jgi:hypothetical protein